MKDIYTFDWLFNASEKARHFTVEMVERWAKEEDNPASVIDAIREKKKKESLFTHSSVPEYMKIDKEKLDKISIRQEDAGLGFCEVCDKRDVLYTENNLCESCLKDQQVENEIDEALMNKGV